MLEYGGHEEIATENRQSEEYSPDENVEVVSFLKSFDLFLNAVYVTGHGTPRSCRFCLKVSPVHGSQPR